MAADLAKIAKERKLEYFLISFVDYFGNLRAKLVPASAIGGMQKDGAGFAAFAAWFDKNVVDGLVKQVESNSVLGSIQIRKVTTGRARDYILMTAVGALSIFALAWGVSG